jgi:hypothetical protein
VIAGQVVVIDGEAWVLYRTPRATQVTGHGGIPVPAERYEFLPLIARIGVVRRTRSFLVHHGREARGYRASDTLPPLLPACDDCEAGAGSNCAHLDARVTAAVEVGA